MAEAGKRNRNIVHCLRCYKPQDSLSVHLMRVCMKTCTQEEREAELVKAKVSSKDWISLNRTWDYRTIAELLPHRPSRMALVNDFVRRGFFIKNYPQNGDREEEAESTTSVATQTAGPAATEDAGSLAFVEPSPEGTCCSIASDSERGASDPSRQREPAISVRANMKAAGLYKKLPEDTELLVGFRTFLKQRKVPNCKQEVDNVSRFLRQVLSTEGPPTMDFLSMEAETEEYFSALDNSGVKPQTICNYLANVLRFLEYLKSGDAEKEKVDGYEAFLKSLRKLYAQRHNLEKCQNRDQSLKDRSLSVYECQKVLRVAKEDILDVHRRLREGKEVTATKKTMYRNYCQAILVLGHFQRPGVAASMIVQEWVNRSREAERVVVEVGKHKTVKFALTHEEDALFQAYYERLRPQDVGSSDCDSFFLACNGGPSSTVSQDLVRLQDMYKLERPANSHDVRKMVRIEATLRFTGSQRGGVTRYLDGTTKDASQMQSAAEVVATAVLLDTLSRTTPSRSAVSCSGVHAAAPTGTQVFSDFVARFPVSKDGPPPTKKARVDAGFPADRVFYDKWRATQYSEREEYLLSQFTHRRPTVATVTQLISQEGWKANHPKPEDVVEKWSPVCTEPIASSKTVLESVSSQMWRGLAIKDFGEKGKGVVATRNFSKGDVVCDYHGKLITAAEGRQMIQKMHDEPGYLFFFKNLCIDAQTFPCQCHPDIDTIGRHMNHSKNNPNVSPVHYILKVDGVDKHVLLFLALTNIKVDEELKFDYGLNQKSFGGEGMDLEWMDK